MSTNHYTLAAAVPLAEVTPEPASNAAVEAILYALCKDEDRYVLSNSRGGAIHGVLGAIADAAFGARSLYIFDSFRLLRPRELLPAIIQLEEFLKRVEEFPSIVVEVTKTKYKVETELTCNGLEGAFHATYVYPPDVCVRDGWVYWDTEADVRNALRHAEVSSNPRPAFDEGGEGLQYAFGYLKSHLAMLRLAKQNGYAVLYAQLGEAWFEDVPKA